ncbi:hypothetical protein JCM11491_005189 [Sporobolomyces phaffii]
MTTPSPRAGLSKRSAGVRRLLQEAAELGNDDSPDYNAAPLESDLFDWHFTIRGLSASQFEGGVYHGRMILPSEYPFKPPEIYLLTPSGRFEVNRKICLSISSFHPETWQPSWGVRTALLALISFFESDPKGAVGSLNAPPEERKRLADASQHFKCSTCGYDAADHASFSALHAAQAPMPETDPEGAKAVAEAAPESGHADDNGEENEEVPESEEISEANSRSSTPGPPEDTVAIESPSSAPTAIFPAAPLAPRNYPHLPSPSGSAPLRSPTAMSDSSSTPTPSVPSLPSPHHHHQAAPDRYRSPPTTPTQPAPSTSRAHSAIPSHGLNQPVPARQSSPSQPATPSTPALSARETPLEDLGGGPPSYIDRAILATLLAIVALIVRKVA